MVKASEALVPRLLDSEVWAWEEGRPAGKDCSPSVWEVSKVGHIGLGRDRDMNLQSQVSSCRRCWVGKDVGEEKVDGEETAGDEEIADGGCEEIVFGEGRGVGDGEHGLWIYWQDSAPHKPRYEATVKEICTHKVT